LPDKTNRLNMKKMVRNMIKWLLRIAAGIIALLALIIILFYLFRGRITDNALDYLNGTQPGEVTVGRLNLRPFMNFPDISLQLTDFQYSTGISGSGPNDTIPVVRMNRVYVSLDAIQLIRGEYNISKVRLSDGVVNYIVESDSVSNLERALGINFSSSEEKDSLQTDSLFLYLDLESLSVRNLEMNYRDIPGKNSASVKVHGIEAGFSYHPERITADLMTHTEISSAQFDEIVLDKPRDFSFSSSLNFDQVEQRLMLEKSTLDMNYAQFSLDGSVDFRKERMDMQFSARNSGIELLNFLLTGVLDMNAIEQIGEGQIRIDGSIAGSFADRLPEAEVNFSASNMGFRVHAIQQSITEIGFQGSASTGALKDFSEAEIEINDFHVSFPEGGLDANLVVKNLLAPEVYIQVDGAADLFIIEEIIDNKAVQNMKGRIRFAGDVAGKVDRSSGSFMENTGLLEMNMEDVGFSLSDNKVESMNGTLYLEENRFGFRELILSVDSNDLHLEGWIDQLLPYFMGYNGDVNAMLIAGAEEIYPERITGDTLFPEPIRDLAFRMELKTTGSAIDVAMKEEKVPEAELAIHDLQIRLPGYSTISSVNVNLRLEKEKIYISQLSAIIGESDFSFSGEVENYNAYMENDSSALLRFVFNLGSDKLLAKDLFTFNDQFEILPVAFSEEQITDLLFKGKIEVTVGDLMTDSIIPNFIYVCEELHWDLKNYDQSFRDFEMDIVFRDSLLTVNKLSGLIGESNFKVRASISNLFDTTGIITGSIDLKSGLLDMDQLMSYALLGNSFTHTLESSETDNVNQPSSGLSGFDFPDLELKLDLAEVRYDGYNLRSVNGKIDLKPYKIVYFEKFGLQSETGGSMVLDGQFNVSDPNQYMLSAKFDVDTVNMSDFNLQFAMGDSIYSLEDNFNGILSTDGIAELFINPDFSIDLDNSTTMFNVILTNGRVKNFAPLHEIGKYTGNKDLDNVKFGELRNGRSFSLVGGVINVPLMSIESTLGLILIEGEQGLGGDFLYLARVPTKLIRGTARNLLSGQQRKDPDEEEEIQQMEAQKFAVLTVFSDGKEEVEVKMGDKRDQYR
jgi:hypothetical protein